MSILENTLRQLSELTLAPDGHPQPVLRTVRQVLQSLDELGDIDNGTRDRVVNYFAELMDQADGPRASALALGCGTLVEEGADPNIALVPVITHLPDLLASATTFAMACVERSESTASEGPIEQMGASVAEEMPREALSWLALEPMGIAAIALLSRSQPGRNQARLEPGLVEAVSRLAPLHPRMRFLARLLQVLDGEPLLVLHPEQKRGYRLLIQGCADNYQLQTLLADALLGDPEAGWLTGKRPDPRVVAIARGQPHPPEVPLAEAHFHLVTWAGLQPDGQLPPLLETSPFLIPNEGIPAEIPLHQGHRVVLLGSVHQPIHWKPSRCFDGLEAEITTQAKLTPDEVASWIQKLSGGRIPG